MTFTMDDASTSRFKVIIIGAGLSGSLLANGLENSGIDYTVYERDRADTTRTGFQIRMGGPALEGMRTCLTKPDLNRIVSRFGRAGGRKAVVPNLLDRDFRPVLDLSPFKNYTKSAGISRVVLRDEMLRPIRHTGRIVYERKLERLEIVQKGEIERVKVIFEGGQTDEADVVIGADGNHSKINKQLGLGNIAPLDTHYHFISKSDVSLETIYKLPQTLLNGPNLAFSDDLSLYFTVYLPDDDAPASDIAKTAQCMFGLFVPVSSVPKDPELLSAEEKRRILRRSLERWAPAFTQMLETVSDADPYVYTSHVSERPPLDWRARARKSDLHDPVKGHPRIWLMGDAMHAMLPYRGMGGNQSMLDAGCMLPHLQRLATLKAQPSDQQVQEIQREYESEMMKRTFAWVEKSGGRTIMPFDTANWWTSWAFAAFRPAFALYCAAYTLWTNVFGHEQFIDDAPELK